MSSPCLKGGALSSVSLRNCFTGQHTGRWRQNMSASLPHRSLRGLDCSLRCNLRAASVCMEGPTVHHISHKSGSERHMGCGTPSCVPVRQGEWEGGRVWEDGAGRGRRHCTELSSGDIFVLFSFWPSSSTWATSVTRHSPWGAQPSAGKGVWAGRGGEERVQGSAS